MSHVEGHNLFDKSVLMIDEYFEIVIAHQIEIHLVSIVPDGHHERTMFIQEINFSPQTQLLIFSPGNHNST